MRVDDVPNARDTGAVGDPNSFIVVFRGPRSPKLTQGTYRIESRTLGTFSLFLVPGWTYASGTMYTAMTPTAGIERDAAPALRKHR